MATDDTDRDDEFDAEIDDQDDTDERDDDKDETVESLRAKVTAYEDRIAKAERQLRKANREAAKLRHETKGDDADETKRADAAEIDQWRTRSIRAEARAALAAAGARPDRLGRLVKLVDVEDIEYDGDDITGLEEQIAELKEDMPELFRSEDEDDGRGTSRRTRRPTPRITAGSKRGTSSSEAQDATTLQVRQLMGIGRRR